MGFPGGPDGKESTCNVGDPGLIPGLGRCPREGNGCPLQYSCLENPTDRGAWWATVHGVTKSQTRLSDSHFHTSMDRSGVSCGANMSWAAKPRLLSQERLRASVSLPASQATWAQRAVNTVTRCFHCKVSLSRLKNLSSPINIGRHILHGVQMQNN